ncbi:MAG: transcription termination/antitermination protein NusG [Oscillospiraceae bacterium]|jgi:transcriptional antiterminator NusG|nr:transcription termination/antitermination protein NusG [Oscillospiraceae bacterium]MBR5875186.1 transcription termination/antitermination protein NusG [Oscillospiraceae bacterium]
MSEAKWYVVHTYSGYENKVASSLEAVIENRNLRDMIQDVKIPVETVVEIKDGKRKETENKLYPSYVFVKMVLTDETWYIVRNTRGVTGFVGASSQKPSPLSQKEVDAMGVESKKQTIDFAVGDNVEIADGPLAGFIGEVVEIDADAMKVKVNVSMFGRETLSELDLLQVKPI